MYAFCGENRYAVRKPYVVHPERYPLRVSNYAVSYPLRGRGIEGVGRQRSKYAVRKPYPLRGEGGTASP